MNRADAGREAARPAPLKGVEKVAATVARRADVESVAQEIWAATQLEDASLARAQLRRIRRRIGEFGAAPEMAKELERQIVKAALGEDGLRNVAGGDHWKDQLRSSTGQFGSMGGGGAGGNSPKSQKTAEPKVRGKQKEVPEWVEGIDDDFAAEARKRLEQNGGYSLDRSGAESETGFMVAPDEATDTRFDRPDQVTTAELRAFREKFATLFEDDRAHFGGWRNSETGEAVLDVSIRVETEAEAMEIARANNQEAIWDNAGKREIFNPDYVKRD